MRDVYGPHEVSRDVHTKELKALCPLHLLPMYTEGRMLSTLRFSKVPIISLVFVMFNSRLLKEHHSIIC